MANYNEKKLPDLSALDKVIKKIEGEIQTESGKLSDYLKKSEAENEYVKKAEVPAVYKPKGSVDDLAGLVELNVEGTGQHYPAGTNVVVVEDQGEYKFDALAGIVDLTNYVDNEALTSKLTNYVDNDKLTTELAKKAKEGQIKSK